MCGTSGTILSNTDSAPLGPRLAGRCHLPGAIMGKLKALGSRLGGMPAKVKAAPKVAEGFYSSPEWRGLVADIKRGRGARCERPGCPTPTHRIIADHIVERKDGGADLDASNVELLCFTHHQQKTAAARAARAHA